MKIVFNPILIKQLTVFCISSLRKGYGKEVGEK